MPRLGVVMIMRNEAPWLPQCLESVYSIADDILVGDTGSTDDSIAIAESYGARVLHIPWTDDFAAARNAVLDHTAADWLFQIDADETLDADGAQRIREMVDADGGGADAFEVVQANYCDSVRAWRWVASDPRDLMANGHPGYIAVPIVRLFRSGRGYEYREPVHESLLASIEQQGGVVRRLDVTVHHYGYAASREQQEKKARRYLAIARVKARTRPDDWKSWYDLAEQCVFLGEVEEGEQAARQAVKLAPGNIDAATCLVKVLLNRGALDDAKRVLKDIDERGDAPAHVYATLGAIDLRQGQNDAARLQVERALAVDEKNVIARTTYARVLDVLGDADGAARELERVCAIAPGLEEFQQLQEAHRLRREGERLYRNGDVQGALETLLKALRLNPEDPLTHNDLGVASLSIGQVQKAWECFERALQLAPGLAEAKENVGLLWEGPAS